MRRHLVIYCADVGSIPNNRFAWVRGECGWRGGDPRESHSSRDIEALVTQVAKDLDGGRAVALGFECPLFFPLEDEPSKLARARDGESQEGGKNRPWSAGAGAAVLATGLAQVRYVLHELLRVSPGSAVSPFLDWKLFKLDGTGLFLWEAFVTGKAKGKSDIHDARTGLRRFASKLPDLESDLKEPRVVSLVGALLLATGWSADTRILGVPCVVVKADQRAH